MSSHTKNTFTSARWKPYPLWRSRRAGAVLSLVLYLVSLGLPCWEVSDFGVVYGLQVLFIVFVGTVLLSPFTWVNYAVFANVYFLWTIPNGTGSPSWWPRVMTGCLLFASLVLHFGWSLQLAKVGSYFWLASIAVSWYASHAGKATVEELEFNEAWSK